MGDSRKELYSDFGEMLFTHFGVSGPVILSASSYTTAILRKRPLKLVIDLKPALQALDDSLPRTCNNIMFLNKFCNDIEWLEHTVENLETARSVRR
jgi:predicted flavoprotein YhiN